MDVTVGRRDVQHDKRVLKLDCVGHNRILMIFIRAMVLNMLAVQMDLVSFKERRVNESN